MVVLNIFYFHPNLGKIPILTIIIFFRWVETTNQHCFFPASIFLNLGGCTEEVNFRGIRVGWLKSELDSLDIYRDGRLLYKLCLHTF